AAVADAERDEAAAPVEARAAQARLHRVDAAEPGQPGHEVGEPSEQLLQALVGLQRDLGAEAAAGEVRGPVDGAARVQAQQVDRPRRLRADQLERLARVRGDAAGA